MASFSRSARRGHTTGGGPGDVRSRGQGSHVTDNRSSGDSAAGADRFDGTTTAYRTCPLCEATCGLELVMRGREIVRVRGDQDDVFSHGFVCPKGTALKALENDPDRLRTPLVRRDGEWHEVSWAEAWAEVDRGLSGVIERHGRDAIALYLGNPNVHNLGGLIYNRAVIRALGTSNVYSASTVDQMPKQVSAGLMFGTPLSVPVPDVDHTDHLLVLGANPYVSNGSLMTAPDMPGRLRALRERGGKLVVVDPRRTKTATEADEHLFIRPGTDAHFLFAIVDSIFEDGLEKTGRLAEHTNGIARVRRLARDFSPERVAPVCGIDAATIRRAARELAAARRAVVYGRIGTCTQEFGTLASWLVDVCNVITGNLDEVGGAMFALPAAGGPTTRGKPGVGSGVTFGRRRTRVRRRPEVYGELPVACLAEEIDTPGQGQLRALVTIAGNPVLSTPEAARLDRALSRLEFMVSVDIYRNETTRHANVILPPGPTLTQGHYDIALYNFAARNVAHYSTPVSALAPHEMPEWEVLTRLASVASGLGPDGFEAVDDVAIKGLIQSAVRSDHSNVAGRDPAELLEMLSPRRGPERVLDFMVRTGPYGDGFGAEPDRLTLDVLEASPHGVDLGPLQQRMPEVLRTPSGKIELAPTLLVRDVRRLERSVDRLAAGDSMVLVGRRDLRSNNSWMHNLEVLVKGKERCTLHVHPDDAARLAVHDGGVARVASRVGALDAIVEVTDEVMPGVVSIPHGWGHGLDGADLGVAAKYRGVNTNVLADGELVDALSGNAVLNGIPVRVEPVGNGAQSENGSSEVAGAPAGLTGP
ncbi:MAG: molybdopterin-dependent oxidoreductase [Actinobacteria bacterium]|nr:molybdopterin-dependent oxidoreductase [Actinomycetota bacterium]